MPKPGKKESRKPRSKEFERLLKLSAEFTSRTRIVETGFNFRNELWQLGFDNGYTIVFDPSGKYRILSAEN